MRAIVKKNTWMPVNSLSGHSFGWGNGYVIIPKGHPLNGINYNEIHSLATIDINGDLTFGCSATDCGDWDELKGEDPDSWVVGFDTLHSWDTLEMWPKEAVEAEAERLKEQLLNYKP